MAKEIIRRQGSATDHESFTGAAGEWTHDTTLKAIRVHDGSQAGGFPIFHEGYVESAPDGGTDAYSADARRPVSAGETVRADFTSANTTTTPTFENTQGTPSGALTITTRDGSALWAGALSGVHTLQLASGGGSWLVLDPNPSSQVDPIAYADQSEADAESYADTQDATFEQQRAQAWVNFDGTGTIAIRDHYNVSSITDNGTGDYTVNFAANLADVNYAAVANHSTVLSSDNGIATRNYAVGSVEVATLAGGTSVDPSIVSVTVFGGN